MSEGKSRTAEIEAVIAEYGEDILSSAGMRISRTLSHHRTVSVYLHSLGVTYLSILMARKLNLRVDEQSLVRGALLHDYFLYDWHDGERWHRFHGFRHPKFALQNAERDFELCDREEDIIRRHMFPLTPLPPRYKESVLVCVADKVCAVLEMLSCRYLPDDLDP